MIVDVGVDSRWRLTVFGEQAVVVASLELLPFAHCLLQLVQLEVLAAIRYCCWCWSPAQLAVLYYYYWWLLMVLLLLLLMVLLLLLLLALLQLLVLLLLLVFEMVVSLEVERLAPWVADGAADQTKALLASLQLVPQMGQLQVRLLVPQADHHQVPHHRQSQSL